MNLHKKIAIGTGVATGVCAVGLLIVVIIIFTKPIKILRPIDCGPLPTVDVDSGTVTNPGNYPQPSGMCGINETMLNALCLQSRCTLVDPVANVNCLQPANQTWDYYDVNLNKCRKAENPTCEQKPCDTVYCNSESVINLLPPYHQITNKDGTCVNPNQTTIAAACEQLPDHQWQYPECVSTAVSLDIETKIDSTASNTSKIYGLMSLSSIIKTESLSFTYQLSNVSKSYTGVLSTQPTVDAWCTANNNNNDNDNTSNRCLTFFIYTNPEVSKRPPPGKYTLTIHGKPTWSNIYTMQSKNPETVTLIDPDPIPHVFPGMNPNPSKKSALSRIAGDLQNQPWLKDQLTQVKQMYPSEFLNPVPLNPVLLNTDDTSTSYLLSACTPEMCPLVGGRLIPYQLVLFSWDQVTRAMCSGGDATSIKYDILRTRSNGIGSSEIIRNGMTDSGFMDLLQIGDSWDYVLRAWQWDNEQTTYETSLCKSEEVTITVLATPFTDKAVCHQIHLDSSIPPWPWATSQGCAWDSTNQSAADYYCAFEWQKSPSNFDETKMDLYDGRTCGNLKQSWPTLQFPWPSTYCDASTSPDHDTCFSGVPESQQRVVICSSKLPIGDSASTVDSARAFSERLDNLLNFTRLHNVHEELDDSRLSKISGTDAQLELYNNNYYHCGPKDRSDTWGINKCDEDGDISCINTYTNGGCDRNICNPWTTMGSINGDEKFGGTRTCFVSPEQEAQCCGKDEKYVFSNTPFHSGKCVPKT